MAVNSFRFRPRVMRAKGEIQRISQTADAVAADNSHNGSLQKCAKALLERFGNQLSNERGRNTTASHVVQVMGWRLVRFESACLRYSLCGSLPHALLWMTFDGW